MPSWKGCSNRISRRSRRSPSYSSSGNSTPGTTARRFRAQLPSNGIGIAGGVAGLCMLLKLVAIVLSPTIPEGMEHRLWDQCVEGCRARCQPNRLLQHRLASPLPPHRLTMFTEGAMQIVSSNP